jgi:PRTRC genetic system ThiF family protein
MTAYIQYFIQLWLYLYQKVRRRLAALLRQAQDAALTRSLNIEQPHRVNIGHPDRVVILLVGVGGTGSFAAHILAQLAVWAKGAGLDLRLVYIDPDRVAEKNLVRQNFCRAEVGYSKAFTLAWRYSNAFGLQITPVAARFSPQMLYKYRPQYSPGGTLTIVVGAVDNFCARRDMAEALEKAINDPGRRRDKFWWIDSGNELLNGQILAGNSLDPQPLLSPLGYCTGVPLPHIQEPGLLVEPVRRPLGQALRQAQEASQEASQDTAENLSCAELTLLEEQSAMINRMMATWLGTYVYRLLQSRDLELRASYINLRTGMVRSEPITGGRVVLPEKPQRGGVPVQIRRIQQEEGYDPDDGPACPNCGSDQLIEGQDELCGELVDVVFCGHCDWRDIRCPACGEQIVDDAVEVDGHLQPAYCCLGDCGWHALQTQQAPEQIAEAETAAIAEVAPEEATI